MPNKKRFREKLRLLKKTNHDATLWDVVSLKQIRYRNAVKISKTYKLEIKYDKIDQIEAKRKEKNHKINLTLWSIETKLKRHVLQGLPKDYTEKEKEIYDWERERLTTIINLLEADVDKLKKCIRKQYFRRHRFQTKDIKWWFRYLLDPHS